MAKINRIPSGFLSLLRGKVGGQTPIDWEQKVRPTIDLQNWYASDVLSGDHLLTASTTTVAGTVATITVPAQQVWMVYAVSGTTYSDDQTVIQRANAFLWLRNLRKGAMRLGSMGFNKAAAEVAEDTVLYQPSPPLIVPGGTTFDVVRGTVLTNGIAINYAVNVLYTPLNL